MKIQWSKIKVRGNDDEKSYFYEAMKMTSCGNDYGGGCY